MDWIRDVIIQSRSEYFSFSFAICVAHEIFNHLEISKKIIMKTCIKIIPNEFILDPLDVPINNLLKIK